MPHYSEEFKEQTVRKMMPPNALSVAQVSRDTGERCERDQERDAPRHMVSRVLYSLGPQAFSNSSELLSARA